jgi:hypothetical protein
VQATFVFNYRCCVDVTTFSMELLWGLNGVETLYSRELWSDAECHDDVSTTVPSHWPCDLQFCAKPRLFLRLLLKHDSPLWTLASNTIFLYSRRSFTVPCLCFIPVVFKFSSNSPRLLLHGLPLLLFSFHSSSCIFFLARDSFAFFQRDRTILFGGIL